CISRLGDAGGTSRYRVDTTALLRARLGVVKDVWNRRGGSTRAVCLARYCDCSRRLRNRPPLRFAPRRAVRGGPRGLQSVARVVLARSTFLRPPRVSKRAFSARVWS